jgi:hypothetical protein
MKTSDTPRSGKLGHRVAYRSRFGQCERRHVRPRSNPTAAQLRANATLGDVSELCNELSDEQVARWSAAAKTVQSKPRNGQSGPLTWQMLFIQLNRNQRLLGLPLLFDPPVRPTFSPCPVGDLHIARAHGKPILKLDVPNLPPVTSWFTPPAPTAVVGATATSSPTSARCPPRLPARVTSPNSTPPSSVPPAPAPGSLSKPSSKSMVGAASKDTIRICLVFRGLALRTDTAPLPGRSAVPPAFGLVAALTQPQPSLDAASMQPRPSIDFNQAGSTLSQSRVKPESSPSQARVKPESRCVTGASEVRSSLRHGSDFWVE